MQKCWGWTGWASEGRVAQIFSLGIRSSRRDAILKSVVEEWSDDTTGYENQSSPHPDKATSEGRFSPNDK